MKWKSWIIAIFCCAGVALSAPRDRHPDLLPGVYPGQVTAISILLNSGQPLKPELVAGIDQEIQRIFAASATPVEVVVPDLKGHPIFPNEILVARVLGSCDVGTMPPLEAHKADTLGRTLVTDGRILPYIEMECSQIASAVKKQILGYGGPERLRLIGRALARVLAHEVYHVLAQTHRHSASGIAAEAISGEALVGERLDFHFEDFEEMGLLPVISTQLQSRPSTKAKADRALGN